MNEEPPNRTMSKMLFPDDRPVVTSFEMAREFGLETSIIMQQLHFLLRDKRNGRIIGGNHKHTVNFGCRKSRNFGFAFFFKNAQKR